VTGDRRPPPGGFYPDPSGAAYERFWDGQQWTGHTRPFAPPVGPWRPPARTTGDGRTPLVQLATSIGGALVANLVEYEEQRVRHRQPSVVGGAFTVVFGFVWTLLVLPVTTIARTRLAEDLMVWGFVSIGPLVMLTGVAQIVTEQSRRRRERELGTAAPAPAATPVVSDTPPTMPAVWQGRMPRL
jgi:hypothetical protein